MDKCDSFDSYSSPIVLRCGRYLHASNVAYFFIQNVEGILFVYRKKIFVYKELTVALYKIRVPYLKKKT